MTTPNWEKIIDDMLATEQAQEWVEPEQKGRFGLNEYYFSEHSLALAILEQFDFDEEFFKQHPELKEYLDEALRSWWEDQIHDDPDVFEGWFLGDKITVHPDAYVEDLVKTLSKEYRKRITETHRCSVCKAEISEAHPFGHENHPYRIGVERVQRSLDGMVGTDKWRHELFCKKHFDSRLA